MRTYASGEFLEVVVLARLFAVGLLVGWSVGFRYINRAHPTTPMWCHFLNQSIRMLAHKNFSPGSELSIFSQRGEIISFGIPSWYIPVAQTMPTTGSFPAIQICKYFSFFVYCINNDKDNILKIGLCRLLNQNLLTNSTKSMWRGLSIIYLIYNWFDLQFIFLFFALT